MCVFRSPKMESPVTAAAPILAATSEPAQREGDLEARMRRMRAGAAADVLTSPQGLGGAAMTFGGV